MLKKFFNLLGSKQKAGKRKLRAIPQSEWVPQQQGVTPEEMCGIDPSTMSREAIRKALAVLYKRHNSAVSSLNPELREEAKGMLDAIVECRERYVDLD